jgi:hypothetical protein
VSTEFSAGTLERYKTSLDRTRNFLKWKYNVPGFGHQEGGLYIYQRVCRWLKLFGNAAPAQPTPIIISEG